MFKQVEITNVTEETKHLYKEDRIHKVFGEKRDEYLIMLKTGEFGYVWKGNCKLVENE